MAVIWVDERLTSAQLAKDLENQRQQWLETATAFERLKDNLGTLSSKHDADERARSCRQVAERLARMIGQMR